MVKLLSLRLWNLVMAIGKQTHQTFDTDMTWMNHAKIIKINYVCARDRNLRGIGGTAPHFLNVYPR